MTAIIIILVLFYYYLCHHHTFAHVYAPHYRCHFTISSSCLNSISQSVRATAINYHTNELYSIVAPVIHAGYSVCVNWPPLKAVQRETDLLQFILQPVLKHTYTSPQCFVLIRIEKTYVGTYICNRMHTHGSDEYFSIIIIIIIIFCIHSWLLLTAVSSTTLISNLRYL